MDVNVWFWSWLVLAAVLAIAESFDGQLMVIPWSAGALVAAGLEWTHSDVGWQWLAFVGIGSVLTVALQRRRLRRHRNR